MLNPLSPHHAALAPRLRAAFGNEFFAGDADVLLSNSDDYLARSAVLNRNAAAMAAFLQKHKDAHAGSPVRRVLYPTLLPDRANIDAVLRRPTGDFPAPGYGCLLSVDFVSLEAARLFYDELKFYPGPHLGAHRTLSLCFNTLAYGKTPEEAEYHAGYGLVQESVRISAGLEAEQDLLDTLQAALDFTVAELAKKAAGSA